MKGINKFVMPDSTIVGGGTGNIELPTTSTGTSLQSIHGGISVMTLPDGSVANVDSSGNILGDIVE